MHSQPLCRANLALAVLAAIRKSEPYYADGKQEAGVQEGAGKPRDERCADFIGWILDWSEKCGDRMPTASGAGKIVVPYQPFKDVHDEYLTCCAKSTVQYQPLGLEQARRVWSSAPQLTHIRTARPKLNFQRCTECVRLEGAIRAATRKGRASELRQLHFERQQHLQLQMAERSLYYKRRWQSQQSGSNCLSLILDKWNSSTTVVPFVPRSPGGWFRNLRNDFLHLAVLLITIHASTANQHNFFVFNKSLKGDSNMNIEGIRRSLVAYSHRGADGGGPPGGHLPATMYIQADSAGDNKSQWMLCWLAWLVAEGYVAEVFLSFLVVGHTHEDVDQTFSLGARYLYKSSAMILTYQAFMAALSIAYAALDAVFVEIVTVLDWKMWFGAHDARYGKEMNHRACMRRWKGLGTTGGERQKGGTHQKGSAENDSYNEEKSAARAFWVRRMWIEALHARTLTALHGFGRLTATVSPLLTRIRRLAT